MSARRAGAGPNVLLGVAMLARGRAEGLDEFGATSRAFLTSLAPLLAFPVVGAALMLLAGDVAAAIEDLLVTLCALLAPAVLSHALARAWGQEARWLRYATAFNWCQWAIPMAAAALFLVLGGAVTVGLPNRAGVVAALGGLVAYGLWLHWFLARHGLGLGGVRSAVLVLVVNVGTALVVLVPHMLAGGGTVAEGG